MPSVHWASQWPTDFAHSFPLWAINQLEVRDHSGQRVNTYPTASRRKELQWVDSDEKVGHGCHFRKLHA